MHKYELVLRILCQRARSLFHAYDTPTYGLVNYNIILVYIYYYYYYESSLLARNIILLEYAYERGIVIYFCRDTIGYPIAPFLRSKLRVVL